MVSDTETLLIRAAKARLLAQHCRTYQPNNDYGREALNKLADTYDTIAETYERLIATMGRQALVWLVAVTLALVILNASECTELPWEIGYLF